MTTSFPPDTNEDGLRDLVTTFQGLHDWIDSLVEKNTLLEKENSELKNAKDAARMLRKENDRLKKQQQRDSSNSDGASSAAHTDDEKSNYILVLVDGNAVPFNDNLLRRGEQGGKVAAKMLLQQALQIGRKRLRNVRFSTMMTVYASVDHIENTLVDSHTIASPEDFRSFSRSFSASNALGNMIDIGDNPSATDYKVQGELKKWHLDNPACRLILLGLSADNSYTHTLEFLKTTNSPNLHKIVLLTGPPLPSDITDLGFHRENMKVFNTQKLGQTYRNSPVAAVRPNSGHHARAKSTSENRWGHPPSTPTEPSHHSRNASTSTSASPWTSKTAAARKASKDRPSDDAFAYIKSLKPGPCNDHYLLGQCSRDECLFRHDYILSDEQVASIRSLVTNRNGPCRYGKACHSKEKCFRHHPSFDSGESGDGERGENQDEDVNEDEYRAGDFTWETTTKRRAAEKKEEEKDSEEEEIPSRMKSRDRAGSFNLLDGDDEVKPEKWWYDRKQLLGIGKLMEEESREGGKDAEEQEEDKYGHPPVDLAFLLD